MSKKNLDNGQSQVIISQFNWPGIVLAAEMTASGALMVSDVITRLPEESL